MKETLSRRNFIKLSIATATALAAGMRVDAAAMVDPESGWRWEKGVCRFCGVGCGLQVASKDGRVVAVKGDLKNPVNRGLLCVKGYANAQILYGEDRLTQPMMRMKDGKFDKRGDFASVSWEEALNEMERQFKRVFSEMGPTGVGIMGSGQYTIQEGYTAVKLIKAGWRSNNIDPNARHCMASAVAAFIQVFGIDEPSGSYDDIELTDTSVLWGANMAEMHPMLWARITDKRLADPDYRIVNLSTYRNKSSEMADMEIIFKPQTDLAIWNYIAREIVEQDAVDRRFRRQALCLRHRPHRHRLSGCEAPTKFAFAPEKDTQARETEVELTRAEAVAQGKDPDQTHRVKQKNRNSAGKTLVDLIR